MAKPTITIDGNVITAGEGETILEVACREQIFIPTLCYLDGLSIAGSCRMCMVHIEGQANEAAACATVVRDGMVIETDNEQLRQQRQMVLQWLFAAGQHVCAVCEANGSCELQALAQRLGVTDMYLPHRRQMVDVDLSHPRFGFDPNRCVLCTRCVRACAEIEGAAIWKVIGRGSDAHISANCNGTWGGAIDCTQCGKCVLACPTGALFDKTKSTGEMKKDCALLARIKAHREKA